jgi:nucleotide-binding universal stress UspA family protein
VLELSDQHGLDGPPAIRTIFVAVSDETPASGVLELVASLARCTDAVVVVCHVREWLLRGSEWILGEGVFVEGKREAAQLLEGVVARLRSDAVRVRGMRGGGRLGQVGRVIVEAARIQDADLIVLGFHRHSLIDEILGGSVARKVRRSSTVPVLTVPRRPLTGNRAKS